MWTIRDTIILQSKTKQLNWKFLELLKHFPSLTLRFSVTHTHTAYSLSLSRPVSHTITPLRRGDNPSQGGGGGGAASWVMSVDTCQKYSPCPEKAVCGVTAVRLPLALQTPNPPPPPPTPPPTPSSRHKSFLCLPQGEKESRRRASREGHQHYSARINAFPLAVSPHCTAIVLRKSEKGFCASECVTEKQSVREQLCVFVCDRGQQRQRLCVCVCSKRKNHSTNLSTPQRFSASSTAMNWIIGSMMSFSIVHTLPRPAMIIHSSPHDMFKSIWTPIHWACSCNCFCCFNKLLERGCRDFQPFSQ